MAKTKEPAKKEIKTRPPIVTLMGHVDHGKTSLLDAFRKSQITATESGGITQHTGAYNVDRDGKRITFIDTPGHEAFTQMRARGGKAADIVILVVAADDGVMPQTKEAITHAKAANVPIIVAINKVDKEGADINKVKRQLSESDILVEGFGGDIVAVETSATTGKGIDDILDTIILVSEMNADRLKCDPLGALEGLVIESKQHPKKGIVVNAVIKNGSLKVRDEICAGQIVGKVKLLSDSYGKGMNEAIPGDAVEILGFGETPAVGDVIRLGKPEEVEETPVEILQTEENLEDPENPEGPVSKKKFLNLVIRADTVGTQEAIVASINKLHLEDAIPNILLAGTGDVKESDILLASTAGAVIMAFKVKVSNSIMDFAESKKVIVREHEIIYKLLEEIEGALEGVLEIEELKIKGKGMVIKVFTLPKSGMKIAGVLVEAGKFKEGQRIGIFRDKPDAPLYVSRIKSVHVGADEVKEAKKGQETGLLLKPQIEDIQLDDEIEVL